MEQNLYQRTARNLVGVLSAIVIALLLTPRANYAAHAKDSSQQTKTKHQSAKKQARLVDDSLDLKGDFDTEVLASKIPVVVEFYSETCPPCVKMKPHFRAASDSFGGRVKFVAMELGNEVARSAANAYGVDATPTVLFFQNGEIIYRNEGSLDKDSLIGHVNQQFKLDNSSQK